MKNKYIELCKYTIKHTAGFVNMCYSQSTLKNPILYKRWKQGLWHRALAYVVVILAIAVAIKIILL